MFATNDRCPLRTRQWPGTITMSVIGRCSAWASTSITHDYCQYRRRYRYLRVLLSAMFLLKTCHPKPRNATLCPFMSGTFVGTFWQHYRKAFSPTTWRSRRCGCIAGISLPHKYILRSSIIDIFVSKCSGGEVARSCLTLVREVRSLSRTCQDFARICMHSSWCRRTWPVSR